MLKASALYIVIVIALVIGLLCSALIVTAYFYKNQYQKKFRYDRLENNVSSGVNILISGTDTSYNSGKAFSLFGNDTDSVLLKRSFWGVYDIGIVKVFAQKDTLFKTFSLANTIDSAKWASLYLIDEDRPFSLSGKTMIKGDAYIPKAGVQTAYVDNKGYEGDKRLIIGSRHVSGKKLPPLDESRLQQFEKYFHKAPVGDNALLKKDSVSASFLKPVQVVDFRKEVQTLSNRYISGNVILFSDTTLIIDNTSILKNVLVFAKNIVVKSGFHGNCQLFATDSIRVDSNCYFAYPSALGVLRFRPSIVKSPVRISIGNHTTFNGLIFSYEKTESPVKPLIVIGNHTKVAGQIYSQGILELYNQTEIDGSIFTSRFLYKSAFTLYENYLINTSINATALSPYYLTSVITPVAGKKKKILQWLEKN
jgi:hypothetical protein